MKWISRGVVAASLMVAAVAHARPGGGHSFSGGGGGGGGHFSGGGGGGGHYSGGGGGGSFGDAGDGVGLVVLVVIGIIWLIVKVASSRNLGDGWNSSSFTPSFTSSFSSSYTPSYTPPAPVAVSLAPVLDRDPDFSLAVFEDYAYQLYAAAHRARTEPAKLAALAPYLSPIATGHLSSRPYGVQGVVIGSLQVEGITATETDALIAIRIESNLVLDTGTSMLAVEHWTFSRSLGVVTKPPERTRTWPCPNCGAPWSPRADESRTCSYCGQAVVPGRFDWAVSQIWLESETDVGPTLTGTVDEQGTELPLIMHPAARENWKALTTDDPNVTWDAFKARVALVYAKMNEGWNQLDLKPARGLVTHQMLDFLRYWTVEYKRQHLHNVLDQAAISNIALAKVRRDKYFDAMTVRVYASGCDFTVTDEGKVVGGSKTRPRAYTEYWTFIRSSTRRGPIVTTPTCANCGAPLDISDSGECNSCKATIDNGSFDWVLSKIEQDEVYRG